MPFRWESVLLLGGVAAALPGRPQLVARFHREEPVQVLPEVAHRLVFRLQVAQRPLELRHLVAVELVLALIAGDRSMLDVGDAIAELDDDGAVDHADLAVGLELALGACVCIAVGAGPDQSHLVRVESRLEQVFDRLVGVFQHVVPPARRQDGQVANTESACDGSSLGQVHGVGVVAVHATVIGGGVAVLLVAMCVGAVLLLGLQVHVGRLSTT